MKIQVTRIPFLPTWLVLMAGIYGGMLPEPVREVYLMGLVGALWVGSFVNYAVARMFLPPLAWANALIAIFWPVALVWYAGQQTKALIIRRRTPAPPSE